MINKIKEILTAEANAILAVPVDGAMEEAIKLILGCQGKVFTTGIGKAGYIARKAASTFSTTGTPAIFLHPGEASHGNIGAVSKNDLLIAYSNSGRTREVLETVTFCKKLHISSVLTITSQPSSPLGELSDLVINIGNTPEACPFGLTPSTSTACMLALSDALAIVSMEERGITKEDYAIRHHSGYIGEQLRKK